MREKLISLNTIKILMRYEIFVTLVFSTWHIQTSIVIDTLDIGFYDKIDTSAISTWSQIHDNSLRSFMYLYLSSLVLCSRARYMNIIYLDSYIFVHNDLPSFLESSRNCVTYTYYTSTFPATANNPSGNSISNNSIHDYWLSPTVVNSMVYLCYSAREHLLVFCLCSSLSLFASLFSFSLWFIAVKGSDPNIHVSTQ